MFKAIKRKLSKIQLRFAVIAIFISGLMWFSTMNFADPITFANFSIELELRNLGALADSGRVILNERELQNYTVHVHVTGPRSQLEQLVPGETIRAFIDVDTSELMHVPLAGTVGTTVESRINVVIDGPGHPGQAQQDTINITTIFPDTVTIALDRIHTQSFNIGLFYDEGSLPDQYISRPFTATPRTVRITAPTSVIYLIQHVGVRLDVSQARADIVGVEVPIVAYTSGWDIISDGLVMDIEFINFTLPIRREHMVRIGVGELLGEWHPNVEFIGMDWTPREIPVVGHVDDDPVDILFNMDISDIVESGAIGHSIRADIARLNAEHGTDWQLINQQEHIITVTFEIEPILERAFIVNAADILVAGSAEGRTIITQSVSVTLRGAASALASIDAGALAIGVNFTVLDNLPAGVHRLPVNLFDIPDGVTLVGDVPVVEVRIQ
ncbi:MAG: hypothetical protein FWC95_07040 [Defluviitaleaceae bacterium]|nr:hypothetical protein [Defluviitaleaceae bacterium]